jgi:hypothetical protein
MRVDELEHELRAERQEPSQDFARRLDEWAEAGFPRDRGLGPRLAERKGPLARAWDRLTSTPPRRILLPAGAVATVVVVAGVAISNSDRISPSSDQSVSTVSAGDAGGNAGRAGGAAEAAPPAAAGDEYNLTVPESAAGQKPSAATSSERSVLDSASPQGAGLARGQDRRIVDATARITLGADADEVQDVANDVVEVTDRYHGVVLDSEVTTDQAGARASFELEIPYKRLDAALTDLSGLADVISRTESGDDITGHAVRARKDLANTLEQLRKQRIALIRADTREQRLVIKAQINSLAATADAYETELNQVNRQGRFATVSVEVTSNGPASDDGNWGLDDAVDDAGDVLETIGGIALVSLAILVPLSLVAALIALAIGLGRRRSRDRALDA